MADVDIAKVSQRPHTNALNYGHLGTATYDSDARGWSFLRRCVDRGPCQSAFPFRIVKRETVFRNSADENKLLSERSLCTSFTSTQRPYPSPAPSGLAPAYFQKEDSLSSAIIASLGQYNSLLYDRLAFGSASCLLDNDVRSGYATVPIAALVSGANSESIILTQIGKDRVNVSDEGEEDLMLQIPTVTCNDYTSWTGNKGTVLQICFAATSGYQSTWMAARLLCSTIIFHPLFHRRPVPVMTQSDSSTSGIRNSNLDANPILSIPISRTGGHPHADISFHPVDCHMLALIDQHGNWSTWNIDGKRSLTVRGLFSLQLLRTGKLYTWENLKRPPQADPYHDGWHRICWVADDSEYYDRVFLANRRDAVIYDPLAEDKYSVSLGLGQGNEAQWILDVKKSVLHPGWVFVLTSTRIFCVSTVKNELRYMPMADSNDVLCSWQHFRARWDVTLSLTILETTRCTVILLTSRINPIANAYRMDATSEFSSIPFSWVEPSLLNLLDIGAQLNGQNAIESPLTLLMRPVQVQGPSKASDELQNLSFNKLFILQPDRSIHEVLLQGVGEISCVKDHDSSNTILLPLQSYVRGLSSKYAELDELDDFVVHESEDLLHAYPGLCEGKHGQRHRTGAEPGSLPHVGIDMQEICEPVNRGSTNELSPNRASLEDYLQDICSKLESSRSSEAGVKLLSDLSSPLLLVADVEASSTTISSLAKGSSVDDQASFVLYHLPGRWGLNSALKLYHILVSNWLSPLPAEVPDRLRVNKERLARNVAADLALAAIATRPSIYDLPTQAGPEQIYPDSAPSAGVTLASNLGLALADRTANSQPVFLPPFTTEEHPACVRLRNYTAVSSNAVTTATPALVFDILAHIPQDAEADPAVYNWRSTEATITAERNEALGGADSRARRRAERLAQARSRRMQLQIEAAEELLRQRAPPAIGSSQKVLPTREVQGSQILVPERIDPGDYGPMTQPERGPFGRRLGGAAGGRKDRGKRKEAGFR